MFKLDMDALHERADAWLLTANAANAANRDAHPGGEEYHRVAGLAALAVSNGVDSLTNAGAKPWRVTLPPGIKPETVAKSRAASLALDASIPAAGEGAAPDPDRWCWPNDPSIDAAMNTAEIALFVRRHARLLALGFTDGEADRIADRLKLRDREVDDRVSCAECRHVKTKDGTCPGGHPLPMTMLHRCERMRPTAAENDVDLECAAPWASPSDDMEPW